MSDTAHCLMYYKLYLINFVRMFRKLGLFVGLVWEST